MKKVPENIMVILKALLPLTIIALLFIVLADMGIGKITEVRQEIATARKDQLILTEKLDVLRTVASTGSQDANIVTNALPDTAPSLAAMAQLKKLAGETNLVMRALKSSASNETSPDFNSVTISFNLIGAKSDIADFVKAITTYAPITAVESVKISQAGSGFLGNVAVKTFWAPFPTKLPATLEQFSDLTQEDKQLINDLTNLRQPVFLALPPPNFEGKEDPFAK